DAVAATEIPCGETLEQYEVGRGSGGGHWSAPPACKGTEGLFRYAVYPLDGSREIKVQFSKFAVVMEGERIADKRAFDWVTVVSEKALNAPRIIAIGPVLLARLVPRKADEVAGIVSTFP